MRNDIIHIQRIFVILCITLWSGTNVMADSYKFTIDGLCQRNSYYPYGGIINNQSNNTDTQPYKYNGKELDLQHGLDLYDYGARMYDPATILWASVDPLAEKRGYYHNI